jgi:LmbE family N-acetylglucosaminyl deacetylase
MIDRRSTITGGWLACLFGAILLAPPALGAQQGGPGTGGVVRRAQAELEQREPRRVLVIGAHPDDEDTELITILSRGMGVETAYLSLTRGEGGQNLIGDELGPALGVVRTEELLAARAVDGGRQFFTRAIDFGFSKSAEETLTFWPRDEVLADIVRVIRRFRPHVIVSVWSGTTADGHGHHIASGLLAREAFDAAQQPDRFPADGLAHWQPLKFYRDYRATGPGTTLQGGVLDPITGHSYRQIAARSRSQHRSQDMGTLEEVGPSERRIVLEAVASHLNLAADTALFAGVAASEVDHAAANATQLLGHDVVLDAYTPDHEVVPGQPIPVTLVAWNAGIDTVRAGFAWDEGAGNRFVVRERPPCLDDEMTVPPGVVARCIVDMQVRPEATADEPYFLRSPPDGAMYHWDGDPDIWGDAFGAVLSGEFTIRGVDGVVARARVPVTARSLSQELGEVRRPVHVVPRVMLTLTPGRMLWPAGSVRQTFTVTAQHGAPDSTSVEVRLRVPEGWQVSPAHTETFATPGEERALRFDVERPSTVAEGTFTLVAEAIAGADTFRIGIERVNYPHISAQHLVHPAEAVVTVAPVRFAEGRTVGYVRGAADRIPEVLAAAGVDVTVLDLADPTVVLDGFDAIVIGPRAYEVHPALARLHPRLLAWAARGGTLITQYQQYQYLAGGFPPVPLTIGRPHDRVTDETAEVTLLDPTHRALRGPNRIDRSDFAGWVQERGLYFARTWDPGWTPLLEMHDPGEAPLRGALLVAPYDRGTVVYTGMAFFRQLPAAVPGAWRLFANLLAL